MTRKLRLEISRTSIVPAQEVFVVNATQPQIQLVGWIHAKKAVAQRYLVSGQTMGAVKG